MKDAPLKIALFLNDDFSLLHFHGGLIRTLVKRGFDVSVIVPSGPFVSKLEELGVECQTVQVTRFMNPIADLRLIWQLYWLFRRERFDILHNYTIKPNIFGTIVAKLAGVEKIVCWVSGSGFIFAENPGLVLRILRPMLTRLYRLSLAIADKTSFENPNDMALFERIGLIKQQKAIVILSGGINTCDYAPDSVPKDAVQDLRAEFGIPSKAVCVLMLSARAVWSKGVREFVEAYHTIKGKYPDCFFIMVAPLDKGTPDAVPEEYLKANASERLIIIDSFRYDIPVFISMCDVIVLPSYYPEGVPRSLLEGLAMGKPIVTTIHQGCREVVDNSENGFLVPVKDSDSLAKAIEKLVDDPEMRSRFGGMSRLKAEQRFDYRIVSRKTIEELYEIRDVNRAEQGSVNRH